MTLVEFFGLPGVGKTALSMRVAGELRASEFACSEPTRRISERPALSRIARKAAYVVQGVAHRPRTAFTSSLAIPRTDQPLADRVRVLFNWYYSTGIASRSRSGVRILDQGIYQALWSVGLNASDDWEAILDRLYPPASVRPSIVVVVNSDDDVIADRNAERTDRSRYDSLSSTHRRRARRGFDAIRDLIRSVCEESPRCRWTEIENDRDTDLDRTAARLSRDIRRRV